MQTTDKKQIADHLRKEAEQHDVEAASHKDDSKRLREAADILDPPAGLVKYKRVAPSSVLAPAMGGSAHDLAEVALRASGKAMTRDQLFDYAQAHGSKVTSKRGFGSGLSNQKRFHYEGNSLWSLSAWKGNELNLKP